MQAPTGPVVADSRNQLTYRQIIAFWIPLGVMWLLMAAEQPGLSAVIARMAEPELHLAAFGVVFALALVVESPIIQMLAAATALSGHRANYQLLLRFMHIMAIALTLIHLLVGLTPAYDLLVSGILRVPETVAEAGRIPFVIVAPFSAAVGYRRFWQGVLIRHGKTWVVPVSIVIRLIAVAVVLVAGLRSWNLSGSTLAAIALSTGVVVAALVAGVLNAVLVMPDLPEPAEGESVMGWHGLMQFYVPLSMTTIIFLLTRPVITFGIARAFLADESLALWPVLNGFLFIFSSLGLSYQETGIALLQSNPESLTRLRRFTLGLALVLSGVMLVAAITPLGTWWFRDVSGLSPALLELAGVPLLILVIEPALLAYKAWYRAGYVLNGRTRVLAEGVVVNTVALFLLVFAGSMVTGLPGVTSAAIALALSQILENVYLLIRRPFSGRSQSH